MLHLIKYIVTFLSYVTCVLYAVHLYLGLNRCASVFFSFNLMFSQNHIKEHEIQEQIFLVIINFKGIY